VEPGKNTGGCIGLSVAILIGSLLFYWFGWWAAVIAVGIIAILAVTVLVNARGSRSNDEVNDNELLAASARMVLERNELLAVSAGAIVEKMENSLKKAGYTIGDVVFVKENNSSSGSVDVSLDGIKVGTIFFSVYKNISESDLLRSHRHDCRHKWGLECMEHGVLLCSTTEKKHPKPDWLEIAVKKANPGTFRYII